MCMLHGMCAASVAIGLHSYSHSSRDKCTTVDHDALMRCVHMCRMTSMFMPMHMHMHMSMPHVSVFRQLPATVFTQSPSARFYERSLFERLQVNNDTASTSHDIASHHITSHHITSQHITSHHITSHHTTPHHMSAATAAQRSMRGVRPGITCRATPVCSRSCS